MTAAVHIAKARALGLAVDVIHRPDVWDELCDTVCTVFASNAFMVFEFDFNSFTAPILRGSTSVKCAVNLVQAHMEGRVPEVEIEGYARFAAFPSCKLVGEYEVYDVAHDRLMPENSFREAVLAASGACSRGVMRLNDIGPWSDVAALHMPIPFAEVDPQLRQDAELILPVIGKAIEAKRVLDGLVGLNRALSAAFDKLDFAAAICRPSGKVIVSNSEFRSMALERDGLLVVGDIVRATFPADREELAMAINTTHRVNASARSTICRLRRRSERLPLIARAIPFHSVELGLPNEALTLLLVVDPDASNRLNVEGVGALGVLSQAELDVCQLIIEGRATQEIADRRGTSLQTVTDQIKSALAKLTCASRIDIVRLAMATRPPGVS